MFKIQNSQIDLWKNHENETCRNNTVDDGEFIGRVDIFTFFKKFNSENGESWKWWKSKIMETEHCMRKSGLTERCATKFWTTVPPSRFPRSRMVKEKFWFSHFFNFFEFNPKLWRKKHLFASPACRHGVGQKHHRTRLMMNSIALPVEKTRNHQTQKLKSYREIEVKIRDL